MAEINRRQNCTAFLTHKRTIENYVHTDAVLRLSQNRIVIGANVDLDYGDVASAFGVALGAAKAAHGGNLGFAPDDHSGNPLPLGTGPSKSKKIITAYVMRHMTADEILARGAYIDPNTGEQRNEVMEWLAAIRAHL